MASSVGSRRSRIRVLRRISYFYRKNIGTTGGYRPILCGELRQGERFLQEVVLPIDDFMVQNGLASVARDEQHASFWTSRLQFLSQLPSAHVRHHHIGDR